LDNLFRKYAYSFLYHVPSMARNVVVTDMRKLNDITVLYHGEEELMHAQVAVEFGMKGGDELSALTCGYDVTVNLSEDFYAG